MPMGLPPLYADYTDYAARVAVVEGYNTNTYQAQDNPALPIVRRHPSPFTGIDAQIEARIYNKQGDTTDLKLEARGQHYEPLKAQAQSDDGSLNAAWSSRFTLSKRAFINVTSAATYTSVNSAHLEDGTLFQFDPTLVRRSYWLTSGEVSLTYELAPTWRFRQAIGVAVEGTVSQPPTLSPSGALVIHRGLDFVQPYSNTALFKDFTERATGDVSVIYEYSDAFYVLDLSQRPPRNVGPERLHFATAMAGLTYRITPALVNTANAGVSVASAPPRDPDSRPIAAPTAIEEISYTRDLWRATAIASYIFGSVNPRLGSGATATASASLIGTPYAVGRWKNLATIVTVQAGRTALSTGVGPDTVLATVAASAELRLAIAADLGLLAGYDIRYASFGGAPDLPPFLRQLFFVGVSGYFTTDKTLPVLTTFAAPVIPE